MRNNSNMPRKALTYNGKKFDSQRSLAAHIGVSESALSLALRRGKKKGISLEEHFSNGVRNTPKVTWTLFPKDPASKTAPITKTSEEWSYLFDCNPSKLQKLRKRFIEVGSDRPAHDAIVRCARDHQYKTERDKFPRPPHI